MNQINRDQIRDIADLYDIKVMSQSISDRGYSCLSHTTRKDLSKADVPTIYNDILAKYDNLPESLSIPVITGMNIYRPIDVAYFKEKYYIANGGLYYSNGINNSDTATSIDGAPINTQLIVGNNIMLGRGSDNKMYKIVDIDNYAEISCPDTYNKDGIWSTYKDGSGYIYITIPFRNYTTADNYCIYRIADNSNATEIETVVTFNYYIYSMVKKGDTWFILTSNGVYSTTNLADTSTWTLKQNLTNEWKTILYSESLNRFVVLGDNGINKVAYSDDDFTTIHIEEVWRPFGVSIPIVVGDTIYMRAQGSSYIVYQTFANVASRWNEIDFSYYGNVTNISLANNNFIVDTQSNYIYYYTFSKTVETDTYVINGTSVAINYYNADGFKICLADGGTNDTNLATVYSYLGYYNYYRLDINNETISLPRNSNLWTYMYVGDNYIDSNLPTGNSTRLLTQSEIIENSSASVSLDIKDNKDYQLTASALTSLTLLSCEDSQLGTTIKFTSGATPTTITDSASINWIDGATPIPSANVTCLIFIWNKIGFYKEW